MDFPITELMDEDACYAGWSMASSRRPGLPPVPAGRPHGRPPARPRPGPGLPLRPLPPGLQRLHRHLAPRGQAAAQRAGPDPARVRPGRADGAAGPRAGVRPLGVAGAPAPGPGRGRRGASTGRRWATRAWRPTRRTRTRGRRACRTTTRKTRRVVGPTRSGATAPGTTTGRRSAGWSGRESGQVRLTVAEHSDGATLRGVVGGGDGAGGDGLHRRMGRVQRAAGDGPGPRHGVP